MRDLYNQRATLYVPNFSICYRIECVLSKVVLTFKQHKYVKLFLCSFLDWRGKLFDRSVNVISLPDVNITPIKLVLVMLLYKRWHSIDSLELRQLFALFVYPIFELPTQETPSLRIKIIVTMKSL